MIKRVIYKKIVDGDLRKFTATSNDTPSGGGARDLRFSPAKEFYKEFQLMFPNEINGTLNGYFHWENHNATEVEIHSPTNARPNEVRIGRVHECVPDQFVPDNADDCILILVQDEDNRVWPYFISRYSLEHDDWHPAIKKGILEGLDARRSIRTTPMGYLDLEHGGSYTNGR